MNDTPRIDKALAKFENSGSVLFLLLTGCNLERECDNLKQRNAQLEAALLDALKHDECEREHILRSALARAESATPAKHPDTVRLDWLEKTGMCFRGADKLAEQTDDVRWEAWIVGNETEWAYYDARAAIDAAMQGGAM